MKWSNFSRDLHKESCVRAKDFPLSGSSWSPKFAMLTNISFTSVWAVIHTLVGYLQWAKFHWCTCLLPSTFKGIVHPKMNILSSFTHPQVVPDLYECICSAEHKGRYSEECGKQSSSGAPLTSIVFFFLLWKSMVPQNSLITHFLQNVFLCFQLYKEIHTGLELLEGE